MLVWISSISDAILQDLIKSLFTMKKHIYTFTLALMSLIGVGSASAQRPDTIWFRYDNRFKANKEFDISAFDTIDFKTGNMTLSKPDGQSGKKNISYFTTTPGQFMFTNPGRILYKPSSMSGDFMSSSNRWCFERSKESDHFVCFWEKGASFNVDEMLKIAERCWDVYTKRLGFVKEGDSSTDTYKIVMRVFNQEDWLASGSGEDMKVGTLNLCPWAVSSRGGATVAHEIGHTFQYLTNVDCGANNVHGFNYGLGDNGWGGNGFWEDCANWMAYKVFPDRQFTDGEYFNGYIPVCHRNIMHESNRYYNCFYQDFLCDRYGEDFIGRLWREAINPEDPVDAIKRLLSLDQNGFSELMYDIFSHMCTWDTPSIRDRAKHCIGAHNNYLVSKMVDGEEWYQIDADHCPENYGYNISELKCPNAGSKIKIDFKGVAGESGYRSVNVSRAGWRWGVVCQTNSGETVYSPMQSSKSGSLDYIVPEDARRLWLVVMGAPTQWWHHAWDDNKTNDEQWPYRVRFIGTSPKGSFHTYTESDFPEGYERKDTTVVINADLAYNSGSYTSVRVQYDMDAISEALGLTTAQLKAIKVSTSATKGGVRFAGVGSNGKSLTYNTTTSTSSSTCYGHWFTTTGNVCNYDGSAAIFAEMYPESFGCYVGQYPGRLKAGNEYIIRQAVVYNETTTKRYTAIMEVHLRVY